MVFSGNSIFSVFCAKEIGRVGISQSRPAGTDRV